MKRCTMNCDPALSDKRTDEERMSECDDCIQDNLTAMRGVLEKK